MEPRKLKADDIPNLQNLMYRVWNIKTSEEFWRWKYFNPPFETAGYVIENEAGGIVAFTGSWIRPAMIHSHPHTAHQLIDIMSDPNYRGGRHYHAIKQLIDSIPREKEQILFGFTNPVSHSIFHKQFDDIIFIDANVPFYSLMMNAGDLFGNRFLKAVISMASRGLLRLLRSLQRVPRGIKVEKRDAIPPEMDQLCRRLHQQYDMCLERSVDYLNWRYVEAPGGRFQIWLAQKNYQHVGYMITALHPRQKGKKKGYILDWYAPRQANGIFQAMLSRALDWFLQNRTSTVDIWTLSLDDHVRKHLRSCLFFRGRRRKSFLMLHSSSQRFGLGPNPAKRFFTTLGDSDFL